MSLDSQDVDNLLDDETIEPDVTGRMLQLSRVVRCEVIRNVSTKDVTGGAKITTMVVGSYESRMGSRLAPDEREYNDELLSKSQYIMEFPLSADILPKDRIAIPGLISKWKPNTPCQAGSLIIPTTNTHGNRHYYRCVVSGITGNVEPQWSSQMSSLNNDNTCFWREAGNALMLEVNGLVDQITENYETLMHVSEVL